jgi:hypothetical protein
MMTTRGKLFSDNQTNQFGAEFPTFRRPSLHPNSGNDVPGEHSLMIAAERVSSILGFYSKLTRLTD